MAKNNEDGHFCILLLISVSLLAPTSECLYAADEQSKKNVAITAEEEVDHLRNWQDVYSSFKKHQQIYDGVIAEAYSEAITSLLAEKWDSIRELETLISSDKAFFSFVLRHIDATCDTDNLREIISNVANNHTSKNNRMCASIRKAATDALQEQNK